MANSNREELVVDMKVSMDKAITSIEVLTKAIKGSTDAVDKLAKKWEEIDKKVDASSKKTKDSVDKSKQATDEASKSVENYKNKWDLFFSSMKAKDEDRLHYQRKITEELTKHLQLQARMLADAKKAGMLSLGNAPANLSSPASRSTSNLGASLGMSGSKTTAQIEAEAAAVKKLEAARLSSLNAMKQEEHHHDSLIVRAVKLVSIYSVLNTARQSFMEGLRSIPTTGIELESTHAIFKAIFVTQKDIEEQFTFLDNLADRTGARLLALQESFREFAASAKFSGESIGNIQQIFADITEAGIVLHLPADKLKSAFTAINQMYAKGQVMMEELKKQLGNQLPAAVAVFARSMGLSTAMLMDKMKKGLVRPEDTLSGFAAMYKQIFASADAFEIASQGMNAAIGRLDTEWTRFAQGVYKSTSTYMIGGLKGLTSVLKTVQDNLGLIGTVAGVAAVAVGVHLAQAFTAFAVKAAVARQEAHLLTLSYMEMGTAARASALAATGSNWVAALGAQLAIIGKIALRWAGWIGVIVAVGTALYKVSQATIDVNEESVKLFDIMKEGWKLANEGMSEYYKELTRQTNDKKKSLTLKEVLLGEKGSSIYDFIQKNGLFQQRDMRGNLIETPSGQSPFSALSSSLANSQASKNVIAEQKAKAAADAVKALADQKLAEERKVLFEDNGLAARGEANAGIVAKNIELQTKVSQSAITSIGHTVQAELKVLEIQKNNLDKQFARNELDVISYYDRQIELLKKKHALETAGDAAKLRILDQEERARIAFEERLVNQELENKGLEDKKNILQSISAIEAYNTKDAAGKAIEYIHTFATNAELQTKGRMFSAQIEANRAAMDREDFKTGEAEYVKAHGSSMGYSFKSKFSGVPTVTSQEYRTTGREFIEKESKAQMEKLTTAITVNTATQEKLMTAKGMNEAISATVSGALKPLTKNVDRWDSLIASSSASANIPPAILKALIGAESMGNPNAVGRYPDGRPSGALGMVQLMPDTASRFGMHSPSDVLNPELNAKGSAQYIAVIAKKLGIDLWNATAFQIKQIVAAYNSGEGTESSSHRKDLLRGKFNPAGDEEGDRVLKYLSAMESGGLRTSKGAAPVNKATTSTRLATSAIVDLENTGAIRNLEFADTLAGKEQEKAYAAKQYVLELSKANLEFKKQEGTATVMELLDLNRLDNSVQLSKLEATRKTANDAIFGASKGITAENLAYFKAIIPLLDKEQQRLDLVEKRIAAEKEYQDKMRPINQSMALRGIERGALSARQSAGLQTEWGAMYEGQGFASADKADLTRQLGIEEGLLSSKGAVGSQKYNEQILVINRLKQSIIELGYEENKVALQFTTQSANMIANSFQEWANGAKTAKEAFRDLGLSFARMIQDMIIKELALKAVKGVMALVGGFSGGGSVAGIGASTAVGGTLDIIGSLGHANGGYIKGYASGGNVLAFPSGGRVRGAGTDTSDSISALVAQGSYVIKASSAKKLAARNMIPVKLSNNELVVSPEEVAAKGKDYFDHVNKTGELKFAEGGMVGSNVVPFSPVGGSSSGGNTYNIVVNVTGGDNPKEQGAELAKEIMKNIAKEEAIKAVALNNKQMKVAGARSR